MVQMCLITRKQLLIKAWEWNVDKVPAHEAYFIFLCCLGSYWFLASAYHLLSINWRGGKKKKNQACDLQKEHIWCLDSSHLKICPPGWHLELWVKVQERAKIQPKVFLTTTQVWKMARKWLLAKLNIYNKWETANSFQMRWWAVLLDLSHLRYTMMFI